MQGDPLSIDPTSIDPLAAVGSCLPALVLCAVLYVYIAWALMTIARKTGTPSAWLAWIPIANLFLMCRIAGRSAGWVLLALIPLLNIIAAIVLFMGMAEARGKSPGLAWLLLVPGVGLIVPLLLALGEPTPAAAAAAGGPAPSEGAEGVAAAGAPAAEAPGAAARPAAPAAAASVSAPPGAAQAPPAKRGSPLPAVLGIGCLVLLIGLGVAGWLAYRSFMGGGGERQPPALPQRAAGVMAEFPVDSLAAAPARPTSVVRESFDDAGTGLVDKIPPEWLPPGLPKEGLARRATAITSAPYRTAPAAPAVPVHVLETPPGWPEPARGIADDVRRAAGAGAAASGIEVTTPAGEVYPGYRIQTAQIQVFVLESPRPATVIVVYAPQPSLFAIAERLASSVANGNGLLDYPRLSRSVSLLPGVEQLVPLADSLQR